MKCPQCGTQYQAYDYCWMTGNRVALRCGYHRCNLLLKTGYHFNAGDFTDNKIKPAEERFVWDSEILDFERSNGQPVSEWPPVMDWKRKL